MSHPYDSFGQYQFNRQVMQERLPKPVYEVYLGAMRHQQSINQTTADAIAHAMKMWAIELGATHFSHWFQPLRGRTAEKHDAFIQPDAQGQPITKLSGKALMKGETDGSSFPNGGLRDTFEARGYTFWDTNSYAFVRGRVLYIPSVFMSYRGDTLDLKMPLIKALDSLSKTSVRVLHDLGKTEITSVEPSLGLEQEFFLVHAEKAARRPDLQLCGRTLFSAQLREAGHFQDTYFKGIEDSVQAFLDEVNLECWKLGIYASVEHNEVSPGQYEVSAVFSDVIPTIDQNMVLMNILEQTAPHYGFQCLLHEKPFTAMNGSGKHNNLSLLTSTGENLFDPGDEQPDDLQFLLFMTAFITAVDRNQALLRMASSDEGNDYRLGGHEAPPAIISVNLGSALNMLFRELAETTEITKVRLTSLIKPLSALGDQAIETTDRNRTSPVSFTGNRFEIRLLGSSLNASTMNTFLYAGMAQVLEEIAQRLEEGDRSTPEKLHSLTMEICHEFIHAHRRILFDGDGYKEEWQEEAVRRGLEIFPSYLESVEAITRPETVELCEHFGILSREELHARREILQEQFVHSVQTQAQVIVDMASRGVYPALLRYQKVLDRVADAGRSQSAERRAVENGKRMDTLDTMCDELRELLQDINQTQDLWTRALRMKNEVRPAIGMLSNLLNIIDRDAPEGLLPYPSQSELVVQ